MKLVVINGPNLNLLGIREPEIYGADTYQDLEALVCRVCAEQGIGVDIFQSNSEGAIIDKIQSCIGVCDGIIINPAGYTHTSVTILDALLCTQLPCVEVHVSDISKREPFRQFSYLEGACVARFCGEGIKGYEKAILFLKRYLTDI